MREEDVKNPEFVQGKIEAFLSFVELIAEQTEIKLEHFHAILSHSQHGRGSGHIRRG